MDYADRPRYYQGRGRLRGSYTRVGDSDEPMTEYEVYHKRRKTPSFSYGDIRRVLRSPKWAEGGHFLGKFLY